MSSVPPKSSGAALPGSSGASRNIPNPLTLFLELADLFEQRGEPKMRDRFVILAADAAYAAGQTQEAERLLVRLLSSSPHHLLKAYRTFAEALAAEPFRTYLNDLKQNYPLADAEKLLQSMRGTTGSVSHSSTATLPTAATEPAPQPSTPAAGDPSNEPTAPFPGVPVKAKNPVEDDQTLTIPSRAAQGPPPPAKPTVKQPPRPAQPASGALPATPASKQTKPKAPVAQTVTRPKAAPAAPLRPAQPESQGSSFLPTLLFLVVFLAGLALLGYALVKPFLP